MDSPPSDLDLIGSLADAFLERLRRGERPAISEYAAQFPHLAGRIREALSALAILEHCAPAADVRPPESPREQIGAYRILREIGRGGMGVVYEAEHLVLRRRVALKVLPGLTARDPTVLERFRREAQAAARLHHTNIVPVFEVGEHEGTWFYAMQLIPGQGLDQILIEVRRLRVGGPMAPGAATAVEAARSLVTGKIARPDILTGATDGHRGTESQGGVATEAYAVAEALPRAPARTVLPGGVDLSESGSDRRHYHRSVAQIGVQTARALGYAHRHGIVHRDIKPSNLLLDPAGTVWVADFGLAKAEGEDLTHTGDVVGTLRYMAPERFHGSSGTGGDVYSLGATLYELLALRPAFDGADRARLIQQIAQTEPPPVRQSVADVPRDLETIVLKAMAKEPARRYESADALADDLQRFVNDEPIRARRVGSVGRLLRWRRRNPALAVAVLGVFVALLSGALVSTWQAIRVTRALEAETSARRRADDARELEAASRRRAREALDTLTDEALQYLWGRQVQLGEREKAYLRKVQGAYLAIAADDGDTEPARRDRAESLYRLARVHDWLGEHDAADSRGAAAVDEFRGLARDFPATDEYRLHLARALNQQGGFHARRGRFDDAIGRHLEAAAVCEGLAARSRRPEFRRELARSHGLAASTWRNQRYTDPEIRAHVDRAIALQRELVNELPGERGYRQELVESLITRAQIEKTASARAGVESYREALRVQQMLVAEAPGTVEYLRQEAELHRFLGTLLDHDGDPAGGERHLRAALAIHSRLAAEFPTIPQYRIDLAYTYNNLGRRFFYLDPKQAEQYLGEALVIRRRLLEEFPEVHTHRYELALTSSRLGELLARQKQWPEAEPLTREALALWRVIESGPAANPRFEAGVFGETIRLAEIRYHTGRPTEARALLDTARPAIRELLGSVPPLNEALTGKLRRCHIKAVWYSALICEGAGEYTEAVALAEEYAAALTPDTNRGDRPADEGYAAAVLVARCARLAERDAQLPGLFRVAFAGWYRATAVGILQRAVDAGFRDAARLRADPDLAHIRNRDDFRNLLLRLDGGAKENR